MEKNRKLVRLGITMVIALVGLMVVVGGCARQPEQSPTPDNNVGEPQDLPETETVTLYFADDQAQYLIAEDREVEVNGKSLAEAVVQELIQGSEEGHGQTIPDGTRLLNLEVEDGVAMVDFSAEFRDNHWGGSAGETMTVYSVVNSLAELEGIDTVQFLLEGEIQEELLGHFYYGEPIEPSWDLVL